MQVRCKFVCTSKREYRGWDGSTHSRPLYEYEFSAVTSGSKENATFFAYTPAGSLKVSTVTDGRFAVGQEYYVDIHEPAPIEDAVADAAAAV